MNLLARSLQQTHPDYQLTKLNVFLGSMLVGRFGLWMTQPIIEEDLLNVGTCA